MTRRSRDEEDRRNEENEAGKFFLSTYLGALLIGRLKVMPV